MTEAAMAQFLALVAEAGLPEPRREYLFAPHVAGRPVRRWRFDLAWPARLVALEIDGAVMSGGRHGGAPSAVRDLEKRQAAAVLGWRVIPVTPRHLRDGTAIRCLRSTLGSAVFGF